MPRTLWRFPLLVGGQVGHAVLGHMEVFRKPWDLAPCCDQTHIRIVLTDKAVVGDHVVGACCMFVSATWCVHDMGHGVSVLYVWGIGTASFCAFCVCVVVKVG